MKKVVFLSLLIVLSNTTLYGMDLFGEGRWNYLHQEHVSQLEVTVNAFLASGDDLSNATDDSPLLDSSLYSDLADLVPKLLKKMANPNVTNKSGETPLGQALYAGKLEPVLMLLNAGADPNGTNSFGYPVLHLIDAIDDGRSDLVAALLRFGADPNKIEKNLYKDTPLIAAIDDGFDGISLAENRMAIVSLLLRYGANPAIKNAKQMDTLACMKDHFLNIDFIISPAKRNPSEYKKIGRAFVRYKILNARLNKNGLGLLPKVIENILKFVDYGLDEKSESTT